MKDIHELISLSLEDKSIPLMFSSISLTSRVRAAKKYYNRLISLADLMYIETSLLIVYGVM